MTKYCKCGNKMSFHLRTVIFKHSIEIENVPIYTCDLCSKSEVFQAVKSDLTALINRFEQSPEKQSFYFNETSEIAYLIMIATQKEYKHTPVVKLLEDRINQLLDLLLLAQSLHDEDWIEDVHNRLSQITNQSIHTYDFT